ncbi:MAG: hypothetical protein QM690_06375 [Sphingobium sp.]
MQKTRFIIAATLALAACDKGKDERGQKDEGGLNNAAIVENRAEDEGPADNEAAPAVPANAIGAASPGGQTVPVALQGRWGLVPKDCGPDAAIAKGLLTIDGKQLRFYESVGKPAVVNYPTPSRMEGRFSFTGEGMEWSKDMALTVEGDTLTRTEKDPAASYRYTRCPG